MPKKRIERIPAKYRKRVEEQVDSLVRTIQAKRRAMGLTQEELAERLDVSPMTVQYLEQRRRDPSVPMLFYICQYLDIELDWHGMGNPECIPNGDPRVKKEAYRTLLPLFSLSAAAGYFGRSEAVEPLGWVEVRGHRLNRDMFVARATGASMEPLIHDGDYLVFRGNPVGSRQGKIVLAQYRGAPDPETGGSFTVKKYASVKSASHDSDFAHKKIMLIPLNPDYEPIEIPPDRAEDFRILAEYLFTVAQDK